MLTGILEPSSGEIMVNGLVPCKNRRQNSYNIGVVFGQRSQLLFDLPVKDSFELIRYMYSIPDKQYFSNLEKYTSVLEIQQLLNRTVRTLSLGQRMRFEILASLLHDPDILFLDEPTIGLDVVAKDRIRSFIKKVNKDKEVTILLTTHDLSDIERLCQRVIIIDKGRVIYDGSLSYIKERFATLRQIRAVMQDSNSASLLASKFSNEKDLKLSVEERTVLITYDQNKTDTSDLLRLLLAQANPQDLTVKDESIESLIRHIYQYGVDKSEQIQKVSYKG
jgi:ABC-2 type transport system ATP-binding protein